MDRKPGTYRRARLKRFASLQGWSGSGVRELAAALSREASTVETDLTNGFPERLMPDLARFFGEALEGSEWVRGKIARRDYLIPVERGDHARDTLYEGVREFLCIRAPSDKPKVSKGFPGRYDDDGFLNLSEAATASRPPRFSQNIWDGVIDGSVRGTSISAIGRVSALAETWAAAELVRHHERQHHVSVYMVPCGALIRNAYNSASFFPVMGACVADRRLCLVSFPVKDQRKSIYSHIVPDERMAATIYDYAEQLKEPYEDLTLIASDHQLRYVAEQEFDSLRTAGSSPLTHYGTIDTFAALQLVVERIVAASKRKEWFPPLA